MSDINLAAFVRYVLTISNYSLLQYPSQSRMSVAHRSLSLDILRGLSAILIVLYHFTSHFDQSAAISPALRYNMPVQIWWGYAAVSIFFMLSGYLGGKYLITRRTSPLRYLRHKAIRLYPTYWVAMTFTWLTLLLFYQEASLSPVDWVANLTMISRVFGVPFVDGVYWTMQCELIFCIIMALMINVRRTSTLISILTCWIFVALIISLFNDVKILKPLKIALIADHCHDFISRLALFMLTTHNLSRRLKYLLVTLIALCILNAVAWYGLSPRSIILPAGIAVVACSRVLDKLIPDNNLLVKVLCWIAAISYPLYLIHEMIGFTIMRHLSLHVGTQAWSLAIPIIVALVLAWLIHRYIEAPRNKTKRQNPA